MTMSSLEKLIVNSDRHGRKLVRWADEILQHITIEDNQLVLDVGCGVGVLTRHVAMVHNTYVTGIDIDPDQILEAQRKSAHLDTVDYFVGDAVRLPFDDHSFDTVMTFKAMHHIPDWQTAVQEMLRVLRPGGYFVFFDLVLPHWLTAIPLNGLGAINWAELDAILSDNGLQVIHTGRSGLFFKLACRLP